MGFQVVKLVDPISNNVVIVASGLVPKGAYNEATDYSVGDAVSYEGSSYVMYVDGPAGTTPTNTAYWMVLAAAGTGGGATAFTSLSDVPASYIGQAGKVVLVNSAETALEFSDLLKLKPLANHPAAVLSDDIVYSVDDGVTRGIYVKFANDDNYATLVER